MGGHTITISRESVLTSNNNQGIRIGANSTLTHSGTLIVNGVSNNHHGITINGNNTSVSVFGSVTINSGGGDALNGSGNDDVFFLNGATIKVLGTGQGISAGGGDDTVRIINSNIVVSGGGRGINLGGGNDNLEITNSRITASAGGVAIDTGANADTVTIRGSTITAIGGGRAIALGGNNDTLNLIGFSIITGVIDGENGTDTINLRDWRGFSQEFADSLVAAGPNGTITVFGRSFTIANFENATASGFQTFGTLITVPGLNGFSRVLDNFNTTGAVSDGFADVFLALNSIPETELNDLAKTASGQIFHHSLSNIAFNNTTRFTSGLFSQLAHIGKNAQTGTDLSYFDWHRRDLAPLLVSTDSRLLAMSNATQGDSSALAAAAASNSAPIPDYEWQTFVMGSGSYASQDATSALAESETISTSATIGMGKNINANLSAGVYVGYQGVDAEVDRFGSKMEGSGAQVGTYARYQWSDWIASGIVGYGYMGYDNERKIVSPGFTGTAESDADSHQLTGALELSRNLYFGKDRSWRLTPKAGLQYALLHVEDFSESGLNGGDLSYNEQTAHSLRPNVGFEISKVLEGTWGWVAPYFSGAWYYEVLDHSRDVTTRFNDPALASFTVSTENPDRNIGVIGAGFNASLTEAENIHFSLGWQVQFGQEGYLSNSATGGFRIDL